MLTGATPRLSPVRDRGPPVPSTEVELGGFVTNLLWICLTCPRREYGLGSVGYTRRRLVDQLEERSTTTGRGVRMTGSSGLMTLALAAATVVSQAADAGVSFTLQGKSAAG